MHKRSIIKDIKNKVGKSGPMVIVTVQHEIVDDQGEVRLTEEHDIVYRNSTPSTVKERSELLPLSSSIIEREFKWSTTIVPSDVLLFRYSALTFNGHRIHYDRTYAVSEELYPGLVVHGPLIATLLLQLLKQNTNRHCRLKSFEFKALKPIFDLHPFHVKGIPLLDDPATIHLFAEDYDGKLAMDATAVMDL